MAITRRRSGLGVAAILSAVASIRPPAPTRPLGAARADRPTSPVSAFLQHVAIETTVRYGGSRRADRRSPGWRRRRARARPFATSCRCTDLYWPPWSPDREP